MGRTGSAAARIPARRPSAAAKRGVLPSADSRAAASLASPRTMPSCSMSRALPTNSECSSTLPAIPNPGRVRYSVTGCKESFCSPAQARMASASGCSDCFSREAVQRISSSDVVLPQVTISVSTGCPWVMVPVLSSTTVSILWAVSSASADLMRMPFRAPVPVPTIMAVGVARPRAQGQEMTSTEMTMLRAKGILSPAISQIIPASSAMPITAGTKMPLILSASRAIGALEEAASSISRMIWARVVSSPT